MTTRIRFIKQQTWISKFILTMYKNNLRKEKITFFKKNSMSIPVAPEVEPF